MLVAVRPGMFIAISVIVMILMITISYRAAGLMCLMVGRQLIMAVRLAHERIMIMIPCTRVIV